jgi:integrase
MSKKFEKLTRPVMRSLSPGQHIMEHGIRYTKLPNGDGRFAVDLKVARRRVHRVFGLESEGVTRQQCEEFIEQVRTEARQNRLKLPKGKTREYGFKEAAKEYLKRQHEEGGKDLPKKTLRLDLHLNPYFGQKPLSELSNFEFEKYKKHRKDQGAKPATINRELAVISHMLNKAVEWGWISHLPGKVKLLKEDNARIVYLTAEECSRLLQAAKNDANKQIYMFILIGLETAMRRSEMLSIRIRDINIPERSIYIPKAKAGARVQPITDRLARFLTKHLQSVPRDQEWLFPSIGAVKTKTGHTTAIEEPFKRVVKAAGLNTSEVVIHTLRHTATTHLVQAGIDLPTVQAITGHKTPAMVHRYAHFNSGHIRAAMMKLEQKYQSANVVPVTLGRRNAADSEKIKSPLG